MPHNATATRAERLAARKELLEREKELTRRSDELARQRRELPWVRLESESNFDFGVSFTREQQRQGIEYNYRALDPMPIIEAGADTPFGELAAAVGTDPAGYMTEGPGLSAFALADGNAYHTYSLLRPWL
jgi:predicted dithiol-disulfide oxidoreductase (DUF899 family)